MTTPLQYTFHAGTIQVSGSLVFAAHHQWREMLRQMPQPKAQARVCLNMAGIDHLDAAGLGLLLLTHDSLKAQQASLTLIQPRGKVRRVLEVSGFAAMVQIED